MEIVEKTIEDQKVAIMNYKGSLQDMEVLIGKLSGWVEVEEIETVGNLFAIFYNNPRTAKENEVVYDVGIPINPELDPDETEIIKRPSGALFAVIVFTPPGFCVKSRASGLLLSPRRQARSPLFPEGTDGYRGSASRPASRRPIQDS